MNYCLSCGANLFMEGQHVAHNKSQIVWTDGTYSVRDVVDCFGPFATCPPPELPADWLDHVVEPSPNELARMNIGGLELAAQFVQ